MPRRGRNPRKTVGSGAYKPALGLLLLLLVSKEGLQKLTVITLQASAQEPKWQVGVGANLKGRKPMVWFEKAMAQEPRGVDWGGGRAGAEHRRR